MQTKAKLAVVLFVLVGLVVAGIGAAQVWMAAGTDWAQTTGTVVKSEVERKIRPADPQAYRRLQWIPRVTFTYEVDGKSYTADHMHAGIHRQDSLPSPQAAQRVLDRYPVDARVPVFFDPDNPSRAALHVGAAGGWVLLVLGGVILAAGGVFYVRHRPVRA